MVCERCGNDTLGYITSMFNTETICFECKDKEKNHPDYQKAVDADNEQIRAGNYNFEGIGKPIDL